MLSIRLVTLTPSSMQMYLIDEFQIFTNRLIQSISITKEEMPRVCPDGISQLIG